MATVPSRKGFRSTMRAELVVEPLEPLVAERRAEHVLDERLASGRVFAVGGGGGM